MFFFPWKTIIVRFLVRIAFQLSVFFCRFHFLFFIFRFSFFVFRFSVFVFVFCFPFFVFWFRFLLFVFRFSLFVFFLHRRSAPGELCSPALVLYFNFFNFARNVPFKLFWLQQFSSIISETLPSARKRIFFCKCYKNLSKKHFHRSPY